MALGENTSWMQSEPDQQLLQSGDLQESAVTLTAL